MLRKRSDHVVELGAHNDVGVADLVLRHAQLGPLAQRGLEPFCSDEEVADGGGDVAS